MGFLLKLLSEKAGFTDELIQARRKPRPTSSNSSKLGTLGGYALLASFPSQQGDACYLGSFQGQESFHKPVFLRLLPPKTPIREFAEAATTRAASNIGGVEQIYSVERIGNNYILVSEYVEGASLAALTLRLQTQGKRLAWPVVFSLFNDAVARLANYHQAGLGMGAITAARIVIGTHGFVYLCQGLFPAAPILTSDAQWGRDLCDLARPIFSLAEGIEPDEINGLLEDGDAAAFDVLLDRVIESQPELEPLAVPVLLRRAERLRELPLPSEEADVERLLKDFLKKEDLVTLWDAVVDCL